MCLLHMLKPPTQAPTPTGVVAPVQSVALYSKLAICHRISCTKLRQSENVRFLFVNKRTYFAGLIHCRLAIGMDESQLRTGICRYIISTFNVYIYRTSTTISITTSTESGVANILATVCQKSSSEPPAAPSTELGFGPGVPSRSDAL